MANNLCSLDRIANLLTFAYLLTAGVTWVAGDAGDGVEGRVAIADVVALFLIALCVIQQSRSFVLRVPVEYRAYLPMLAVFLFGVIFADYPVRGYLELLVHIYLFVGALALYNLHVRAGASNLAELLLAMVLYSGAMLALAGLVDFLIWPNLFPGDDSGLTGTFRNTGQAGAFFGIYLAIVIPGLLSGLIKSSKINIACVFALGLALLLTSKRAALIGLASGLAMLVVKAALSNSRRDKKRALYLVLIIAVLLPIGYLVFSWGMANIDGMAWRFEKKFGGDVADRFTKGFLEENIQAATTAFEMKPLIGVGLGNVAGIITSKYEIHSTYLAIIGNDGILGVFTYCLFMGVLLWKTISSSGRNVYGRYLGYFSPMLIGLMISWAYTYHLRKREFWIMFFIVSTISHLYRSAKENDCLSPQVP